jgi:hypothetical protein
MKMFLCFLIPVLFFHANLYSQKTPVEFGNTAFYCFQHNRLDSLFGLVPTLQELSGFAKELGIREGTEAYTAFVKRYPLVVKSFRDKCYQIQWDSLGYHFSWTHAHLENLEPIEKTVTAEGDPNKKPVSITALNIYFTSKGQSFVLKFGDLHPYNGRWKPGNDISLTIKYQ